MTSDLQTALTLLHKGRHKAAFKTARRALARAPNDPALANVAGVALCAGGQHRDSIPYFKKALQLAPAFQDARKNLVQSLVVLNLFVSAKTAMKRLVHDSAGDAGAWYLVAQVQLSSGQLPEAMQSINHAIDLDPHLARHWSMRGLLHARKGRNARAITDYTRALDLNPGHVETLINISLPLAREMRSAEAMAAIRRAVDLAPDHVTARLRLAAHHTETGALRAAIAEYRQVLKHDTVNAEALERLAALNTAQENAALAPTLKQALKRAPKHGQARASLCFAQARLADQQGELASFANWLGQANHEMARIRPFDAAADAARMAGIIDRFPTPLPRIESASRLRPIYVVGLPRSGTTLVEAMLGAHADVAPLGERATPGMLLFPKIDSGALIGAPEIAAFRAEDTDLLPPLPAGTRAYVDKMPENYRLIGFLIAAYPDCRIINMHRDPRDVALSMWRDHFAGSALNYTYDLGAMAGRFNRYARMMVHWQRLFPGQILDIGYEDLVRDIDITSRKLAGFCDLEWHPEMALPDQNAGQILTLSATQLRQPVHGRSIGKWRAHERMLAPFTDALDPAFWPEVRTHAA